MSGDAVAFGRECVERSLNDAEFLARVKWLPTAGAELQQAATAVSLAGSNPGFLLE